MKLLLRTTRSHTWPIICFQRRNVFIFYFFLLAFILTIQIHADAHIGPMSCGIKFSFSLSCSHAKSHAATTHTHTVRIIRNKRGDPKKKEVSKNFIRVRHSQRSDVRELFRFGWPALHHIFHALFSLFFSFNFLFSLFFLVCVYCGPVNEIFTLHFCMRIHFQLNHWRADVEKSTLPEKAYFWCVDALRVERKKYLRLNRLHCHQSLAAIWFVSVFCWPLRFNAFAAMYCVARSHSMLLRHSRSRWPCVYVCAQCLTLLLVLTVLLNARRHSGVHTGGLKPFDSRVSVRQRRV